MSVDSYVLSETDSKGVTTLLLNRANKHNAFDDKMIAQLTTFLEKAIHSKNTKIIVIKAKGPNFSAGADLKWMCEMAQYSDAENKEDAMRLGRLMHTLYLCPKPTIALVQGKTFGGGVGLIACCQIVLAEEKASFCFSEARLGIIPAVISPFIVNAIGTRWARHYFLRASPFDASEALRMGLCHHITVEDRLPDLLKEIVDDLLANGPLALQHINLLLNKLSPIEINNEILIDNANLIANLRVSDEGQTGLNAFLNKKKPNWSPQ